MFKHKFDPDDCHVSWTLEALYNRKKPLTQEEIIESVYERRKKKWRPRVLRRHLNAAVENNLLLRSISADKVTYYPAIAQEVYKKEQEERFLELMRSGAFSKYVASHMTPPKLTEKDREELLKLIEELE